MSTDKYDCVVLGLDGAGKTLLVKRLRALCEKSYDVGELPADTVATIGIEVDRFSYKAKDLSLREVGGSFGPIWSDYYQDAKRILFVVDGASQRSWPAAAVLFWELVEDHALNNTPIAFALNKMDEPVSEGRSSEDAAFRSFFRLRDYQPDRGFHVFRVSALHQKGVKDILQWIAGETL